MSKRPPSRRGITFEVGARLEARDRLKKWYTAHIEKIDYDEGKVLIHFKRWNHRYDEWFNWDSVYLRPLERPLLRKEGAKLDEPTVEFRPGEQVLACWSDCRFYPAKVISVNKDASYTVEFYDGVIQNVKKIHVKSLPKSSREKNAASGRNKENGTASARRRERFRERFSPSLASQQVGEDKPVVIEEEGEVVKLAGEAPGQLGKAAEVPAAAEKKSPAQSSPPGSPPPAVPPSKPEEKRKRGRPPSVGLAGGHSKGAASQDRRLLPARQGGSGTGKRKCASAASTLSKQMKLDQGQTAGSQEQSRRRSLRLASGDSNSSAASVPSEGTEARSRAKEQDCAAEAAAAAPATETPAQAQQEPTIQAQSSTDAAPNTSVPTVLASPEQQLKEAAKVDSPEPGSEPRDPPPEAAPVVKRVPRSQNPNRYSREPLTNTAQSPEEQLPPKALIIDLDHNKFKCKIAECSKAFRKAKMLHYHMKYYHGIEKAESEQGSPKRSMQTRGSCASETESLLDSPKRRRTTSGSLHGSQNVSLRDAHTSSVDPRAARLNEKRRISAPSSLDVAAQSRLSLREKARDNQTERSHRKLQDRERGFTDSGMKEKNKEKKVRDFLKVKLKKKKKKKKKVKSELSDSEENIDVSRDCPPKKSTFLSTRSSSSYKFPFSHKYTTLCTSDSGYLMEGLTFDDVSDEDSTSDSSTDSLLWSEDEYSQEVDVTTNAYDTGDGEDSQLEIVRCICEVEEENEFMIQCEECLCWQHGVCMGLLEDSVPEVYTCYVCRDPPGEPQAAAGLQPSTCLVDKQPAFSPRPYTFVPRGAPPAVDLEGECTVSAAHEHRLSSRYWYDKEWLSSGHMHGLTFLKENYSHQNSGNIVATHQLLGDVHRVIEVLHGLQLKIYILQNKDQPDLKLWSKPWRVNSTAIEKLRERHSAPSEDSNSGLSASAPGRTPNGTSERQNRVPVIEESYITSEHCYQKPRAYYPAAEQRLVVETRNSSLDEGFGRMRENGDETLAERFGRNVDEDSGRPDYDFRREQDSVCKDESGTGKVHGSGPAAEPQGEQESCGPRQGEEGGAGDPQLQWQVNLLAHVESLQDEACHRMDFIERELDVLESWLDYSGELEPPDPLARLPQLKNRMKQLLADLGKVQQIASYCPV